ncbi:MAG: sigma-70 family RNA polymerase sigma factor [Deltaproteobacteria bacterium]|nr:sigma-70 family RNA polymerase sigma factor [Deltaproteobacteria bacterium]
MAAESTLPAHLARRSEKALAKTSSDAELVVRARGGNRVAFSELYERYHRLVHGALVARVPLGEVDDLAQDVFLTAMRRLHTLRDEDAVGGWLLAIARNRAATFYRRRKDTTELPDDLAAQPPPSAEAAQVLATIRKLPDAYRETLAMRLIEGMTGPEIAEQTGLTPGSVRVNLHRGMKQLRELLEDRQ